MADEHGLDFFAFLFLCYNYLHHRVVVKRRSTFQRRPPEYQILLSSIHSRAGPAVVTDDDLKRCSDSNRYMCRSDRRVLVLQYSKKGPGVRHFMDIKDERVPQHLRAENTRTFPNALGDFPLSDIHDHLIHVPSGIDFTS